MKMASHRLSVLLISLCLEQVFVDGFFVRDRLNQQKIENEWNARKCFETNMICKGEGATCKDDGRTCNCPDGLLGDDCSIKEAEAVCNDDGTAVFTFMVNSKTGYEVTAAGDGTSSCADIMRSTPVANGLYVQYQLTLNYNDVLAQSEDCAKLMVKDFRTISMNFQMTSGQNPSKTKHLECLVPAEAATSD